MKTNERFKSNMYKRVETLDSDYLESLRNKVKLDNINYPSFHIAPKYGLLNDPNGLSYYNGQYHIFYQWCPNEVAHGMKNWNHLTTKDFINYEDNGIALKPEYEFENYGIYSGGAKEINGNLNLFYTGNRRIENDDYTRVPTQCVAVMDKDNNIISKKVLIDDEEQVTEHFRDPVPLTIQGKNIVIVGAQETTTKHGKVLIYEANEDFSKLENMCFLEEEFDLENAYMYECPSYIENGIFEAIIFSPQGITNKNRYLYNNVNNVTYSVSYYGDILDAKFENKDVKQLDHGFDFYAPQTFKDEGGRNILIAWLGHAETIYPGEVESAWSQMLTIPRELSIIDNHIYQQPIAEFKNLRSSNKILSNGCSEIKSKTFEVNFEATEQFELSIGNDKFDLKLLRVNDELVLDRSNMQYQINEQYGTVRYVDISGESKLSVQVIVDKSSIEIFINKGKYVLTSRYAIDTLSNITIVGCKNIQYNELSAIKITNK